MPLEVIAVAKPLVNTVVVHGATEFCRVNSWPVFLSPVGLVAPLGSWLAVSLLDLDATMAGTLVFVGSILGSAAVAGIVYSYKSISKARRDERIAWDQVLKDSLSEQNRQLNGRINEMHDELSHAERTIENLQSAQSLANAFNQSLQRELSEANRRNTMLMNDLHELNNTLSDYGRDQDDLRANVRANTGMVDAIIYLMHIDHEFRDTTIGRIRSLGKDPQAFGDLTPPPVTEVPPAPLSAMPPTNGPRDERR